MEYDKITFGQAEVPIKKDPSGELEMLRQKQVARVCAALVLSLSLFVVAPLAAQNTSGEAVRMRRPGGGAGLDYRDYDAATLERGKTAFVAQCGFCHGSNARGGESGPDLIRSVTVIDDENGNLIGPVIQGARQSQGMPKFNMTPAQISDIVAFLHEGVRAAAERGTYKLLNIVTGNAKAGETYFNGPGKCNTCHSTGGDLKGIGAKYDPITLQGRLLMPIGGRTNGRRNTSPIMVTVTLPSGKSFQGTLNRIDDFNVSITDANGDYHSFERNGAVPKVDLKDPVKAHFDLLPRYTDADMHNLTAYLVTLK
ncbi:MAG TPA: cytochrome c [Bryobacteraceae bacterium]|nr:cytochrome c [Bryobacteraceae bacterium]